MLVLTRRQNESIVIARGTPYESRVTVAQIREGKVRLGFEAADHVTVHRHEVQKAVDGEGREPAAPTPQEVDAALRILSRAGYSLGQFDA